MRSSAERRLRDLLEGAPDAIIEVLRNTGFPTLAEYESDLLMVGEHPQIPLLPNEVGPRFEELWMSHQSRLEISTNSSTTFIFY